MQCSGPAPRRHASSRGALIDITGQWVSVINEDWRWRMVTPPKGDTASVPLNPAGRRRRRAVGPRRRHGARRFMQGVRSTVTDPAAGAHPHPVGGRQTLLLEFDAGTQTRRVPLRSARRQSAARFRGIRRRAGSGSRRTAACSAAAAAPAGGSLDVDTNDLRAGLSAAQRRPYSERAVVKEFFDTLLRCRRTDVADRHDGRQRPGVPDTGIRPQLPVQEGTDPSRWSFGHASHAGARTREVRRAAIPQSGPF